MPVARNVVCAGQAWLAVLCSVMAAELAMVALLAVLQLMLCLQTASQTPLSILPDD